MTMVTTGNSKRSRAYTNPPSRRPAGPTSACHDLERIGTTTRKNLRVGGIRVPRADRTLRRLGEACASKLPPLRPLNGANSTLAMSPETNLVWTVLRAIWGNPQCAAPNAELTIEKARASATNAAVSFRPGVLRAEQKTAQMQSSAIPAVQRLGRTRRSQPQRQR